LPIGLRLLFILDVSLGFGGGFVVLGILLNLIKKMRRFNYETKNKNRI
jgi:hypothetical protein